MKSECRGWNDSLTGERSATGGVELSGPGQVSDESATGDAGSNEMLRSVDPRALG
ncbi:MAG: hypothetical protein WBJ68_08965 [Candidatus Dechloromonas phosphoritropha]